MKVKEFIELYHGIPDDKTSFIVKPLGTVSPYFNSKTQYFCNNPKVHEMIVKSWSIIGKNTVIIIVEQNKEFEAERKARFEKLKQA